MQDAGTLNFSITTYDKLAEPEEIYRVLTGNLSDIHRWCDRLLEIIEKQGDL